MDVLIDVVALLMGVIGLLGCFLPVLPGPPLSYAGLVLLYFWGNDPTMMSATGMWIWLFVVVAATILDYVIPAYYTRKTGGSKSAARASLVGMLVGIPFFPPLGMIVGSFLGAYLAELWIERKTSEDSFRAAWGTFVGFLLGTGMKLIISIFLLYYILRGF